VRRFDTVFRNIQVYTTTLDFPLVLSNSSQTIDVAVAAGAAPLGTTVRLIPLSDASSFDDMVLQANVVVADSIRFVMINPSAGAINPAAVDFAIWTGEINTDLATPIVALGNVTLQANVFENIQSFGTDASNVGVRLTPGGIYQFSAEANTGTPLWQDVQFGTQWIDDGGASAAFFEAQLVPLNVGNLSPVFTGWSGFNEWLPVTQNLELVDANLDPATSTHGGIVQVEIREIAIPANIVTGIWEGNADNEP
jgi:hypothetical protein